MGGECVEDDCRRHARGKSVTGSARFRGTDNCVSPTKRALPCEVVRLMYGIERMTSEHRDELLRWMDATGYTARYVAKAAAAAGLTRDWRAVRRWLRRVGPDAPIPEAPMPPGKTSKLLSLVLGTTPAGRRKET